MINAGQFNYIKLFFFNNNHIKHRHLNKRNHVKLLLITKINNELYIIVFFKKTKNSGFVILVFGHAVEFNFFVIVFRLDCWINIV